jgi:hypothetical protein
MSVTSPGLVLVDYNQLIEGLRGVIRHELLGVTASNCPPATPADAPRLPRTAKQIAEKFDVCVATVWEWRRQGKFTGHTIGGRTYFFEDEVLAALQSKERTKKVGR